MANPFSDSKRAWTFIQLIDKILEFSLRCKDQLLELGETKEIEESYEALKSEIKDITELLKLLIPGEPKKKVKKNYFIRVWKRDPSSLVKLVDEIYKPKLRKYYKPPYRGDKSTSDKLEDIQELWENEFSPPYNEYPGDLGIDDRSETTIAVSIVAYWSKCNRDELLKIYYKAVKQAK